MKDLRIPGVVWAIVIIVAVALVHENQAMIQAQFGLDAFVIDLCIGLLIAVLKTLNLGTDQLNQALNIIDRLLARPKPPTDGKRSAFPAPGQPIMADEIPKRPNKLARWLVG